MATQTTVETPAPDLAVAHLTGDPDGTVGRAKGNPDASAAVGNAAAAPATAHARAVQAGTSAIASAEAVGAIDPDSPTSSNRLVARVVANTSLLTALLIYMGWDYLNARLGYFGVSPLNLNLGVMDYALHSLAFFFSTNIILTTAILIAVVVIGPRAINVAGPRGAFLVKYVPRAIRAPLKWIFNKNVTLGIRLGLLLTISAVPLAWTALHFQPIHNWFAANLGAFYLVVLLVGAGSLLLTKPTGSDRGGHFLYPLAIAVASACALWVAGLYAQGLGTKEAENIANHLAAQTAVTLYSVRSLGISGPGVKVQTLHGSIYHYRYDGLRLLIVNSGTYYLLPVGWSHQDERTYIVDDTSEIRIELS